MPDIPVYPEEDFLKFRKEARKGAVSDFLKQVDGKREDMNRRLVPALHKVFKKLPLYQRDPGNLVGMLGELCVKGILQLLAKEHKISLLQNPGYVRLLGQMIYLFDDKLGCHVYRLNDYKSRWEVSLDSEFVHFPQINRFFPIRSSQQMGEIDNLFVLGDTPVMVEVKSLYTGTVPRLGACSKKFHENADFVAKLIGKKPVLVLFFLDLLPGTKSRFMNSIKLLKENKIIPFIYPDREGKLRALVDAFGKSRSHVRHMDSYLKENSERNDFCEKRMELEELLSYPIKGVVEPGSKLFFGLKLFYASKEYYRFPLVVLDPYGKITIFQDFDAKELPSKFLGQWAWYHILVRRSTVAFMRNKIRGRKYELKFRAFGRSQSKYHKKSNTQRYDSRPRPARASKNYKGSSWKKRGKEEKR